jgi:hypothetical protein
MIRTLASGGRQPPEADSVVSQVIASFRNCEATGAAPLLNAGSPQGANAPRSPVLRAVVCLVLFATVANASDDSPTFFRGVNLGGPAVTIDDQAWDGNDSKTLRCNDKQFDSQNVALNPPTDPQRAMMIRSSRWGGSQNRVELTDIPRGKYSVFLYVWEDNNSETYDVSLNGRPVLKDHQSGAMGHWEKLGPWVTDVRNGTILITSIGGAANFSGVEVWKGEHDGADPAVLTPENIAFFESRIRPLLIKHCYECHSLEGGDPQGGLLLDSRFAVRKGGEHGPAILDRDPDHSLLVTAVRFKNGDLQMPPDGRLPDEAIADLERWVKLGAPDPRSQPTRVAKKTIDFEKGKEFWSLKPVVDPPLPPVKHTDWATTDLDRFILARLEAAEIPPATDADKATLIRRLTYDLIGLPPTPEEIDAFTADDSPLAYENLVERLLSSPQYGERWGRYWLDVVRYSDTAGDNSDFPIPQMYRYRNWVIEALNRDMPYDQFVRQQLAGDLLPAASQEQKNEQTIATGYIANARRFGSRVDDYPQHLTIEDTIDNVGRAFLGLTVNCARCHDHKFDPISTEDYYGLYGIFQSTRYPWPGIELEQRQRDLISLCTDAEREIATQTHRQRQNELEAEVKKLEKERDSKDDDARKELDGRVKKAKEAADAHKNEPLPIALAYAVTEGKQIEDAAVQKKGDPTQSGDVVPRRFLAVMGGQEVPEGDQTSGRRQLADWITDRSNPLAARVLVNRVWQYHFGRGIVPTPNDFGKQGKPPSHPELLDWLASRFLDNGQSVKSLHKLIVLSRTYRLSSHPAAVALEKDPSNELLSSFPCRRLDAEAIRDTLLVLGGNLDATRGEEHPFPPQSQWKFTQHNPFKAVYDTNRRSVYLMTQRIQRHPYLAIFDGADPAASTPYRPTSTTPLQALYLLNDPFVHEQAKRFADRIVREGADDASRLDRAYLLALGRRPSPEERTAGLNYLKSVQEQLGADGVKESDRTADAWMSLSRAILRLNEFVYID